MNVFNSMSFVRCVDERDPNYHERLYNLAKRELELVKEFDIPHTSLIQYDVMCDDRFINLFKEMPADKTEFGVWLEIVEPLTSACGLPYRSEKGWKWDWHIIPGLPMGYEPHEREMLIDETMRKFKEVFGYYPRTFGGWLIDTYTMDYLCKNYEIDAICICRDQVNTDAYTLVGGYFNGAYFPSKNNIFIPAQTEEYRINTPVFRLLGPCPINNYDSKKFVPEELDASYKILYTLEPAWAVGRNENCISWFYKTYFENESLGFSCLQIGQENSFTDVADPLIKGLRMQLEKASEYVKAGKAKFMTYSDTGKAFKELYKDTPATAVTALDNWNSADTQSVYYDCKNYVANIFRYENNTFIRAFYAFDERIKDYYMEKPCTTFDAVYESLPIVDTVIWQKDNKENIGLILDTDAIPFTAEKTDEGILAVNWGEKTVTFTKDGIKIEGCGKLTFAPGNAKADIALADNNMNFSYKGNTYSLMTENCKISKTQDTYVFEGNNIKLIPKI